MKKIACALLLTASATAQAGLWATTSHSRANCLGFNESITWNGHESHWWRVRSIHFHKNGSSHIIDTGMNLTWRAAAYHMGEYGGPWHVQGYHFYLNGGREIYDYYTDADDCNIYDGWWD